MSAPEGFHGAPFYSQYKEDAILAQIFNGRASGTCVEVGAFDGVTLSNTYHFEQLGWSCVLVEPNPEACRRIRLSRRAKLFECAASNADGKIELHVVSGAPMAEALSAIAPDEEHLRRIRSEGGTSHTVTIPSRTLNGILDEAGVTSIDFITIDVEGQELNVLDGFDLERFKPRILILEDNDLYGVPTLPDYMARRQYRLFLRTACNHWFAREGDPLLTWKARLVYRALVAARRSRWGRKALGLLRRFNRACLGFKSQAVERL